MPPFLFLPCMLIFNDQEHRECLNCGTPLKSNYCAHCGQAMIKPYGSFWYIVREFLANLISFDAQVFKTLRPLLFRPGRLTVEYAAGRRVSYIHPIKLYVFTSIVFFLVFPLTTNPGASGNSEMDIEFSFGEGGVNAEANPANAGDNSETVVIDSLHFFEKSYPAFSNQSEFESYLDTVSAENYPGPLIRAMIRKTIGLDSADPQEVSSQFWDAFLGNTPKMLFLLLPVFALLMQLLHVRKAFRYEEHLIFAIHFHTFLFFLILFFVILGKFWSYFWLAFPVLTTLYFFISVKRFYKQRNWTLAWKGISMMFLYFIVFVALSFANFILAFLQY